MQVVSRMFLLQQIRIGQIQCWLRQALQNLSLMAHWMFWKQDINIHWLNFLLQIRIMKVIRNTSSVRLPDQW